MIEKLGPQLTLAERKIMSALESGHEDIPFLSTNELAKQCGVNPATVVRFARKLGFAGYPALRSHMQHRLLNNEGAAARLRSRMKHLDNNTVLEAFITAEIGHLSRFSRQLPEERLVRVAEAIIDSRHVYLFAVGHAGCLTTLLSGRLARIGVAPRILPAVVRDAAVEFVDADGKDVFIAFALNFPDPATIALMDCARGLGITTVLITDKAGIAADLAPDVALIGPRGEEEDLRSLIVPMTICYGIVLHVMRAARDKSIDTLERLDHIRKSMGYPG
jgi:DNA-binding MurR/RpiR family transcriptional regulator